MRDRLSTKILSNGATRYGVYDETGNLLRYEYIKLEDEPTVEGDLFGKANMLPDSIPAALGLKMENPQVKDALNVLANIGNLHVWMKTVVTKEPVPAGYTLGAETNTKLCYMYYTEGMSVSYASSVSIDDAGNVSLVSPASISLNTPGDTLVNEVAITKGKFVKFTATNSSNIATPGVYFIPTDATFTYVTSGTSANQGLYCDKAQKVNPYPITPAGTTTDYLTSTDRSAYPDQSATGGQDAYYTLGDVVSNYDLGQSGSNIVVTYSSDIAVDARGMITLVDPGSIMTVNVESLDDVSILLGKFVKTSADSSGNIVFIPTDATASYNNVSGWTHIFMSKYQPVTGYAAIPANTTITYLGQLGNRARIETGSYVGTGTYGISNPNSLTFGFEPKIFFLVSEDWATNRSINMPLYSSLGHGYLYRNSNYENRTSKLSWNGKTISWYATESATYQCNNSGTRYYYTAIG